MPLTKKIKKNYPAQNNRRNLLRAGRCAFISGPCFMGGACWEACLASFTFLARRIFRNAKCCQGTAAEKRHAAVATFRSWRGSQAQPSTAPDNVVTLAGQKSRTSAISLCEKNSGLLIAQEVGAG